MIWNMNMFVTLLNVHIPEYLILKRLTKAYPIYNYS